MKASDIAAKILANRVSGVQVHIYDGTDEGIDPGDVTCLARSHQKMEATLRNVQARLQEALKIGNYWTPKEEILESLKAINKVIGEKVTEIDNADD
jgi:hypothetical protein